MKLCFATNNLNKIKEIQRLLPDAIQLVSLEEIGCHEELREDQDTLEGNSRQKATYVFDHFGVACFADDTGLEVEALGGAPGVYSARYAGDKKNSDDNIDLLLQNLKGVSNRSAQFRTVITLVLDNEIKQFEGIAKGEIIEKRSGKDGFGYDPVFKPAGYDSTFAEMTMEEKNAISHRGQAVRELVKYLKKLQ